MNHITITNRANPNAVAHPAATRVLRSSLLVLTVLALTTHVAATPVFFSVDPSSPIVVVHGRSPADIFDPVLVGPGPPPSGTCKTAADLGLAAGDNVDAGSVVSPHLLDAVGTVIGAKGNIVSNYYIWSVDRASVGRASGDLLCNLAGVVVPSVGSPVLDETAAGDSACGDVFMQVWTLLPPWPRVNLLWLEEVDNEETDGVFGGPGLDELDALAIVCGDEYFFSVDPATAASLGVSPASILRVVPASGAWTEMLTPADLGLDPDDDIDALNVAVFDSSSNFIIAFSLAPGSPSLIEPGTGFTWSPADIFLVSNSIPYPGMDTLCDIPDNRCWVPAEYLSLLPSDNLDALIVTMDDPCPKPLSEPTPTGQQFIRGDANQDFQVDMADSVFIMSYLSAGGPSPECMDAADADDSGTVDTSDVTFILNYTLGAAPPPPPFPDCGPDPTDDSLTCDKYDRCPGSSIPVAPQDTKWIQVPDVTNHGIDIRIDSSDGSIRTLADDFECRNRSLITDVHLWGSWKDDVKGDIKKIHLSIHADDPAGPAGPDPENEFSKPAPDVLWAKDFFTGQFGEGLYYKVCDPGEWWWDPLTGQLNPGGDTEIWQIDIDIEPDEAFLQTGSQNNPVIYWLDVQVDTEGGEFGWKTRQWPDHYMDDAVYDVFLGLMPHVWRELRYPETHPYHSREGNSIDMAFCLTYSPETPPQPTTRPVSPTQCPVVQTQCPSVPTRCPAAQTRCPAVQTRCPAVQTRCPAVQTQCPAAQTRCPVLETLCPAMETECSATRITECPPTETTCPALLTVCPVKETQCPPTETECSATRITECPPTETTCPALLTQCPVYETRCPADPTRCPPDETRCPVTLTQCRSIETLCPLTLTRCFQIETRCPATETECQSVDTQCPPVDTECPREFTTCPAIPTTCEIIRTQCPVETVCPPTETECHQVETECPICPITVFPACPPRITVFPDCPMPITVFPVCRLLEGSKNSPVAAQCPTIEVQCPTVVPKHLLAKAR